MLRALGSPSGRRNWDSMPSQRLHLPYILYQQSRRTSKLGPSVEHRGHGYTPDKRRRVRGQGVFQNDGGLGDCTSQAYRATKPRITALRLDDEKRSPRNSLKVITDKKKVCTLPERASVAHAFMKAIEPTGRQTIGIRRTIKRTPTASTVMAEVQLEVKGGDVIFSRGERAGSWERWNFVPRDALKRYNSLHKPPVNYHSCHQRTRTHPNLL